MLSTEVVVGVFLGAFVGGVFAAILGYISGRIDGYRAGNFDACKRQWLEAIDPMYVVKVKDDPQHLQTVGRDGPN